MKWEVKLMAAEGISDNVVPSQNAPQSQLKVCINSYDYPDTGFQMLTKIKKISTAIHIHN